jgi:hypothetical protein
MKYINILLTFLSASVVQADFIRDRWMIENKIDPDYMHAKAMESRSLAMVHVARRKAGYVAS